MSTEPGGCLDRDGDMQSCTSAEGALVRERSNALLTFLAASGKLYARRTYPGGGTDGGFIHTCLGHADSLRKNGPYTQTRNSAGVSIQEALLKWYLDDASVENLVERHWYLPCNLNSIPPLQCNPTCAAWSKGASNLTPDLTAVPQSALPIPSSRVLTLWELVSLFAVALLGGRSLMRKMSHVQVV